MGQFGTQPTLAWLFALLFASSLLCTRSSLAEKTLIAQRKLRFSPVIKPTVEVTIWNSLPNDQNLTIHCKSKDDDLGVHVLPSNGTFRWKFKVNLWHTTLFFCGLSWSHGSVEFDAYKAARDYYRRCNYVCDWNALADGIYGFTDRGFHDITVFWNK